MEPFSHAASKYLGMLLLVLSVVMEWMMAGETFTLETFNSAGSFLV